MTAAVEAYLARLPDDQRAALSDLRITLRPLPTALVERIVRARQAEIAAKGR